MVNTSARAKTPQNNTLVSSCRVCKSRNLKELFIGSDRLHALSGQFPIVQCKACGLVFLNPQPSMKSLMKYYPQGYHAYAKYNPHGKKERLAVWLFKLYFSNEPLTFKRAVQRLACLPLRHLLRGTWIKKNARILDVGCGNGAFLHKMRMAGMRPFGVEISSAGCKEAKGLGIAVSCGTVEEAHLRKRSFDVITLNHVLEHVPDPVATAMHLRTLIKNDGRIIIALPNTRSLAFALFRKYWASLDPPRHLTVHSPKTMRLLAKRANLRVKSIRYISFPFQFQGSIAYVLNRSRSVPLEETRIGESRLLYWLLFPLVYIVDILHIGDVIEVTLVKN